MFVWIFIIPCLIVLNMVNTSPGKTKDGVKVVDTLIKPCNTMNSNTPFILYFYCRL
jgi:hypothetical protein